MSHQAIRTLIEDTVKSIDRDILFGYARKSDFNSIGTKADVRVQLDPLKETTDFIENSLSFTKTYTVALVFSKKDDLQGAEEETAKILDETDDLSDQLIVKLNRFVLDNDQTEIVNDEVDSNTIELSSITKEPIIKVMVDCITGWLLQFKITVPNTFDYCSVYE